MTWSAGESEPYRTYPPDTVFSRKVFISRLLPETEPAKLGRSFQAFGLVRVVKNAGDRHAYVILESDACVKLLLWRCSRTESGEYLFRIANRKIRVIPWALRDIEWGRENTSPRINTIFVWPLHEQTTAELLKIIMEEQFGPVRFVRIDTDNYEYPNGSGRVQFVSRESYCAAINVKILKMLTMEYECDLELEPFFESDVLCSRCRRAISSAICRHYLCLQYFCGPCFEIHQDEQPGLLDLHQPCGHP
ncbi:cytoplasmic polyadenylation element-binding protein 1-like [Galendromus occidentalis]|uniref:Cytoplasmic polyadenylation element-binding protein 1-like n=1 Tax=Galendromus occidentalis TaxID=34638 RepID=A0AAJ6QNG2_9ACAR|nr:cytoplasmic polyadenylation element-binding protein 1-like [Galendromus occidentalis]